jgi:hypothetical protein
MKLLDQLRQALRTKHYFYLAALERRRPVQTVTRLRGFNDSL